MPPPHPPVRVRRADESAIVAAFAAAWLVAALVPNRPTRLLRSTSELIELDVHPDCDRSALVADVKELLGEHRFRGWELCHD